MPKTPTFTPRSFPSELKPIRLRIGILVESSASLRTASYQGKFSDGVTQWWVIPECGPDEKGAYIFLSKDKKKYGFTLSKIQFPVRN